MMKRCPEALTRINTGGQLNEFTTLKQHQRECNHHKKRRPQERDRCEPDGRTPRYCRTEKTNKGSTAGTYLLAAGRAHDSVAAA